MASKPRLWLTPLHRAEWAHAIEQHVFRRLLSRREARQLHALFEQDRAAGVWAEVTLPEMAWEVSVRLARRHAARDRASDDVGDREAEVGAAGESPVATGRAPSDGKAGIGQGHGGDAAVVGPALRFALNARPSDSQGFAPGKAHDKEKNKNQKAKRGHF